jgi:hypothetical protein
MLYKKIFSNKLDLFWTRTLFLYHVQYLPCQIKTILNYLKISLDKGTACLKNVNNRWNTNISFYLETSDGQNSNLYLNVVQFFNTSIN